MQPAKPYECELLLEDLSPVPVLDYPSQCSRRVKRETRRAPTLQPAMSSQIKGLFQAIGAPYPFTDAELLCATGRSRLSRGKVSLPSLSPRVRGQSGVSAPSAA